VIVDVHTHPPTHRHAVPAADEVWNSVWRPDRAVRTTTSWEDYERAFADIDLSIAFNIAVPDPLADTGLPAAPQAVNDSTAEFVAARPDRRLGFMSVHPHDPSVLKEVDRCVGDLGLVGIKLGPNYQNFDPLEPRALEVYEEAQRRQLPIMFHQGASPIRTAPLHYAHPLTIDRIAIAFPDLKIVMAHMGHPWQADTITVIRKHPNVYADVSALFYRQWSLYSCLRLATEWGVLDKLLFGSDYPVATPAETIDGLRSANEIIAGTALPPVPLDRVEEVIHRDSLSLLGLQWPT
jgi:uncharacterized protein